MLIESNRVNKGLRNVKSARLFIRSAWPSSKKRGNLQNMHRSAAELTLRFAYQHTQHRLQLRRRKRFRQKDDGTRSKTIA